MWYLTSCLLVVINHAIQIATFWRDDIFGTKCYLVWETCSADAEAYAGCFPSNCSAYTKAYTEICIKHSPIGKILIFFFFFLDENKNYDKYHNAILRNLFVTAYD